MDSIESHLAAGKSEKGWGSAGPWLNPIAACQQRRLVESSREFRQPSGWLEFRRRRCLSGSGPLSTTPANIARSGTMSIEWRTAKTYQDILYHKADGIAK